MKLLKIIIFLFFKNVYLAFSSSQATTGLFTKTTCRNPCCADVDVCYETTSENCNSIGGFLIYDFNAKCKDVMCPSTAKLKAIKGCTILQEKNNKYITWYGYENITPDPIYKNNSLLFTTGDLENGTLPTIFLPGKHFNLFSLSSINQINSFTIKYGGINSTVTSDFWTTCNQYCCNSTYCKTTNLTCDKINISGSVVSGGLDLIPGIGSNCTQGQNITEKIGFPCKCTEKSNPNGECGKLPPVTIVQSCKIAINGVCYVEYDFINNSTETLCQQKGINNNVSLPVMSGNLTLCLNPGITLSAEKLFLDCSGGLEDINRIYNIQQIFD